eukprot:TRINITY_DN9595_c0_g1_i1.p1 TRINITY_DN9595_c0_g1~~TRINITY_DN9595_c0_g1_i1.p1  ORF type:complete len:92 (-),score=7.20 TRINITY_DN9595_c0_g1_i1:144-419(-)
MVTDTPETPIPTPFHKHPFTRNTFGQQGGRKMGGCNSSNFSSACSAEIDDCDCADLISIVEECFDDTLEKRTKLYIGHIHLVRSTSVRGKE